MIDHTVALDLLTRCLVAALCGGVLGLEREWANKPAGLRTQVLITVGAALLTAVGEQIVVSTQGSTSDVTRVAASIAPGLGFLGAGTIIQRPQSRVSGLTTAAMVWVNGGIGMAIGFRLMGVGVGTTLLVLGTVVLLRYLERWLRGIHTAQRYQVITTDGPALLRVVEAAKNHHRQPGRHIRMRRRQNRWEIRFSLVAGRAAQQAFLEQLITRPDVEKVQTF